MHTTQSAATRVAPFSRDDALKFVEAMEKVCGMLSTVGEGVPWDMRMALLDAKRECITASQAAAR